MENFQHKFQKVMNRFKKKKKKKSLGEVILVTVKKSFQISKARIETYIYMIYFFIVPENLISFIYFIYDNH